MFASTWPDLAGLLGQVVGYWLFPNVVAGCVGAKMGARGRQRAALAGIVVGLVACLVMLFTPLASGSGWLVLAGFAVGWVLAFAVAFLLARR